MSVRLFSLFQGSINQKWNSYGILQEYWWKTWVANTLDDFEILQEFQSEFLMEMQLTQQMATEFL